MVVVRWSRWGIRTFISLRTHPKSTKLFTFSLSAQIERVRELARVAFLAQTPLVVLADQVVDPSAFVRWREVSVWTGIAESAAVCAVRGADGSVQLRGVAEWWVG